MQGNQDSGVVTSCDDVMDGRLMHGAAKRVTFELLRYVPPTIYYVRVSAVINHLTLLYFLS